MSREVRPPLGGRTSRTLNRFARFYCHCLPRFAGRPRIARSLAITENYMKNKEISKLLSFYQALGRPITSLEIWRLLPASVRGQMSLSTIINIFNEQEAFVIASPALRGEAISRIYSERKKQDLLADKKWKKLLKYSRLFSFIPFVDFVFGAGSLALGNVHSDSDFDVLIGVKYGRIFTARFFSIVIFSFFNIRRKKIDHKENAKDKICLNHFVTEKSYCLKSPYNHYWQNLYKNLVPVYGSEKKISEFYKANNSWLDFEPTIADHRLSNRKNFLKDFLEYILNNFLGDQLEKILRYIQLQRIQKNLAVSRTAQNNSRLSYTDEELEFHPDTLRIEKLLEKI